MTANSFCDVVLIDFPMSGTVDRKRRPALVVLDIGDADVVVAPITSRRYQGAGDHPIQLLDGTGLVRTSYARLAKVATLLKSDIVRKMGSLSDADRQAIATIWSQTFGEFAE